MNTVSSPLTTSPDPFDLNRFVQAQKDSYDQALAEIRRGAKRSHWMWFIFPQFAGLGFSPTSQHYAIKSLSEARAYLEHPMLGPRLLECMSAAIQVPEASAYDIFGSPDDMKLRSSATLFQAISPPGSIFEQLLTRFFDGQPDDRTMTLLAKHTNPS
jgi:uncharacterized protein (DUF1810 family)